MSWNGIADTYFTLDFHVFHQSRFELKQVNIFGFFSIISDRNSFKTKCLNEFKKKIRRFEQTPIYRCRFGWKRKNKKLLKTNTNVFFLLATGWLEYLDFVKFNWVSNLLKLCVGFFSVRTVHKHCIRSLFESFVEPIAVHTINTKNHCKCLQMQRIEWKTTDKLH